MSDFLNMMADDIEKEYGASAEAEAIREAVKEIAELRKELEHQRTISEHASKHRKNAEDAYERAKEEVLYLRKVLAGDIRIWYEVWFNNRKVGEPEWRPYDYGKEKELESLEAARERNPKHINNNPTETRIIKVTEIRNVIEQLDKEIEK